MIDAEGTGLGHLVQTHTLLVRIMTCPSAKPQEKGGRFTRVQGEGLR